MTWKDQFLPSSPRRRDTDSPKLSLAAEDAAVTGLACVNHLARLQIGRLRRPHLAWC